MIKYPRFPNSFSIGQHYACISSARQMPHWHPPTVLVLTFIAAPIHVCRKFKATVMIPQGTLTKDKRLKPVISSSGRLIQRYFCGQVVVIYPVRVFYSWWTSYCNFLFRISCNCHVAFVIAFDVIIIIFLLFC